MYNIYVKKCNFKGEVIMARMKTFFLYFLGIVGFFFLSLILEDGLIENMYVQMVGDVEPTSHNIYIENVNAKASNVNGYMQFQLSADSIDANNKYVKIELYSDRGLLSGTKYVDINDLEPGTPKTYQVKFDANKIRNYKLAVVDQAPDKSNIINILGFEVDLSNVLGMDLTNATIFGTKLTELFSIDGILSTGASAWNWFFTIASAVPWWGYAIGAGIVLWYLPKKYLFGIFPF